MTLFSGPISHVARIVFRGDDKQAHQQAREITELFGCVVYDWCYGNTPELPEYSQEIANLYIEPKTLQLEDDPPDPVRVLRPFVDEVTRDMFPGKESGDLEPDPPLPPPPVLDILPRPEKTNKKGHLDIVYTRTRKSLPRKKGAKRVKTPGYVAETFQAIKDCTLDGAIPATRGFITERLAWLLLPTKVPDEKVWAKALYMTLMMVNNGVLRLVLPAPKTKEK